MELEDPLFNRDLSWLSFNERVLREAADRSVPLYERIKFLAIYSSNLDEFFRVRVAHVKRLLLLDKKKLNAQVNVASPQDLLQEISETVNRQQEQFGGILREQLLPELKENRIHLYYNEPFLEAHLESIEYLFYTRILSFVQPLVIPEGGDERIFLENRQLYLVSCLEKDGMNYFGVVNIPSREAGRFHKLPEVDGCTYYTFVDDIVRHFKHVIFPGFSVRSTTSVKLNRDAELFLEEEYEADIAQKIKKSLKKRDIGAPSRFLYEPGLEPDVIASLQKQLNVREEDGISGGRYHNLDDLFALPNPLGEQLENKPMPPLPHPALQRVSSIFKALDRGDVLLSFPYHRYDYVLRLFNEAAIDPAVTRISATLYRVAKDSHITNALVSAARNGKEVSILVEAKARFDEENNLVWAEKMQQAGVRIRYSDDQIKVHSKVAQVHRTAADGSSRAYAFLGTGNFNEKTARIYTDYALLTADDALNAELDQTLRFILGNEAKPEPKLLLVSQVNMRASFKALLKYEMARAQEGERAYALIKLNNLEDPKMIRALYKAADIGVEIDLIVRGICCLVPRPGIRITRIVDRFLEHARVYYFHHGGDERMYVGSADWMTRNLDRRIEVAFPIRQPHIRSEIREHLQLQLTDCEKAVRLSESLENVRAPECDPPIRAQHATYALLAERTSDSVS